MAALSTRHPSSVLRPPSSVLRPPSGVVSPRNGVLRRLPRSLLLPGFVDPSHVSPSPRKVRRYGRSESFPTWKTSSLPGRSYKPPFSPQHILFISPCNSSLLPYPTSYPQSPYPTSYSRSLFSPRLPIISLDHSQSPNHLPTNRPLQAYQDVWSHQLGQGGGDWEEQH
jgi:hypothetical protein